MLARRRAGAVPPTCWSSWVNRVHVTNVLGFWDKNSMVCAGAMPYRRDFPALSLLGSRAFKLNIAYITILPTILLDSSTIETFHPAENLVRARIKRFRASYVEGFIFENMTVVAFLIPFPR